MTKKKMADAMFTLVFIAVWGFICGVGTAGAATFVMIAMVLAGASEATAITAMIAVIIFMVIGVGKCTNHICKAAYGQYSKLLKL